MRRVALAILLTVSATCTGTSSDRSSPSATIRDCTRATFPFPDPALVLSEADGASRQVSVGALIEVTLRGDAAHRWEPIALSGDALVARPDPEAAATVGTQLGVFCAARVGQSVLSSGDGSRRWSVTLDVVR